MATKDFIHYLDADGLRSDLLEAFDLLRLAILIIEDMEANMSWVCAECGGDLIYPGAVCIKDETHRGQMKLEDWEAKKERKEVMEREARDAVELLFGPRDSR